MKVELKTEAEQGFKLPDGSHCRIGPAITTVPDDQWALVKNTNWGKALIEQGLLEEVNTKSSPPADPAGA